MTAIQTEAKQSLAFFSGAKFSSSSPTFSRTKNDEGQDVLRVEGMAIFRSGQFRDSMGYEHTYDPFHINQMVSNFGMLTENNILTNLPVRAGHPSPFTNYMNEMIGSIVSLRTQEMTSPADGENYTYLIADFDVWDEAAADHIEKKHWVNRSSEIGMYGTNNGMEFYPTLVGFAYVDIPAVEGLNFSKDAGFNKNFVVACDDEIKEVAHMGASSSGNSETGSPAPFMFSLRGGLTTADFAAVQAHITEIEGQNDTLTAANAELEEFAAATKEAARTDFITSCLDGNKVLASSKEDFTNYVNSLTDEQFLAYSAIMAAAPALAVLSTHGSSTEASGTPDAPVAETEEDKQVAQAQRVYDRLIVGGMTAARAKETASGKLLAAKGLV